jgi:hypothetical protein
MLVNHHPLLAYVEACSGMTGERSARQYGVLPTEPVLLTHGLVARSGRELNSASSRLCDSLAGYFGSSGGA